MPNKYVKKKPLKYTEDDINKAASEVKNNQLSMYAAAKKYSIPSTTLYDRIKNTYGTSVVGRRLAIPLEVEKQLADAVKVMEKWGFGLSREEVLNLVQEFVRQNKLETPFTNNRPGKDWFINFRKRNGLSIKKPQPVEYVRKKMTDPFVVSEYFELLEKTLTDYNLFERPHLIWNLDETSLSLDPTKTKVVGAINKPCSRTTCGTGKENITVLTTVNATGQKISPLIVFKGKNIWDQWMAKTDNYDFELSYAASSKGWMETEIFYNYMKKILIPALGEERPALIIYDGHSTHVDTNVIDLAIKNDVIILKLPPHTSHLLQPLDVAVFKSFKTKWDGKLVEWQRHNVGAKMPKNVFAQSFAETWQETSPEVIKSGFKKAGIYPFDSNIVPEEKYDPAAYRRYKEVQSAKVITSRMMDQKNPKSLKKLCVDLFNRGFGPADDTNSVDVSFFNVLSKTDMQTQSFISKSTLQLPECMQKNSQSNEKEKPKIKIISDIKVNFEELLLEKIRQDKKENVLPKKKRIAKGAEVITAAIHKKNNEDDAQKNYKERLTRTRTKTRTLKKKCKLTKEKNKMTYKKPPDSNSSTTTISDIMSIYSDIEVDYCEYERLSDVFWDEPHVSSHSEVKSLVLQEESNNNGTEETFKYTSKEKKSLNEENKNSQNKKRVKGKGKGKKTKSGKENSSKECDNKENIINDMQEKILFNNKTEIGYKTEKETTKDIELTQNKTDELRLGVESVEINEEYMLNDAVIVRYFSRKKWTYYIGFVEDIFEKSNETYYTIDFLKTHKKPNLTFVQPKKKDRDHVTELLIIKKVDLIRNNENYREFNLAEEIDKVYFI